MSTGRQKKYSDSDIPGPGQYNPSIDSSSKLLHNPKWSIGHANNRESYSTNVPGPGAYDPKQIVSIRTAIMSGKLWRQKREMLPGPGNYNTDSSQLSKNGAIIGKEKRDPEKKSLSPGPGEYNVQKTTTKSGGFYIGKAPRQKSNLTKTLGPGAYDIPSTLRFDQGPTLQPRRDRTYSTNTPAPNQYEIKPRERVISFKIGNSIRDPLDSKSHSPGPGLYYPTINKPKLAFSIGKEQRDHSKLENLPGPGQYDPKKIESAPKFSMLSRHSDRNFKDGPGPQEYQIKGLIETKNVLFGKSTRDQQFRENIPVQFSNFIKNKKGPGQYLSGDISKKSNTSIIFGRERRDNLFNDNGIPGPGQYKIKSQFD